MIGSGFLEIFEALAPSLRRALGSIGCTKSHPLVLAGHSLGGAVATVFAHEFKKHGYNVAKVYTFGQPKVGNKAFAASFGQVMRGIRFNRVVRFDDPIVPLPVRDPDWEHVGHQIFYPRENCSEGYAVCEAGSQDGRCAPHATVKGTVSEMFQCGMHLDIRCGHLSYYWPRKETPLGDTGCSDPLSLPWSVEVAGLPGWTKHFKRRVWQSEVGDWCAQQAATIDEDFGALVARCWASSAAKPPDARASWRVLALERAPGDGEPAEAIPPPSCTNASVGEFCIGVGGDSFQCATGPWTPVWSKAGTENLVFCKLASEAADEDQAGGVNVSSEVAAADDAASGVTSQ